MWFPVCLEVLHDFKQGFLECVQVGLWTYIADSDATLSAVCFEGQIYNIKEPTQTSLTWDGILEHKHLAVEKLNTLCCR